MGEIGKRGVVDVFCLSLDPEGMKNGILFNIHGGITFSGELKEEKGFWYGFDCAHCDDLSPLMSGGSHYGEYRDMEYVTNETESLAEQLKAIERDNA